jgi:tRNA (adenine57-N1/adenine58-N1)-methyltransferase
MKLTRPEVSTQEVLIRTHDIPNERNSGQKPLRDIESIVGTLQSHEVKKAERRVTQMRNAREKLARVRQAEAEAAAAAGNAAGGEAAGAISDAQQDDAAGGRAEGVGKRKLEEQGQEQEEEGEGEGHAKRARIAVGLEGVNGESGSASASASVDGSEADLFADDEQQDGNDAMRSNDEAQGEDARGADDIAQEHAGAENGSTDAPAHTDSGDAEPETEAKAEPWVAPPTPASTLHSQIILRLQPEMRGHTSYLTFATLPPLHIRDFLAGKTDSSRPVPTPAPKSDKGKGKGKEKEVVDEEDSRTATATETEFADPDLDDKLGTLTEEEMIAMLSRD